MQAAVVTFYVHSFRNDYIARVNKVAPHTRTPVAGVGADSETEMAVRLYMLCVRACGSRNVILFVCVLQKGAFAEMPADGAKGKAAEIPTLPQGAIMEEDKEDGAQSALNKGNGNGRGRGSSAEQPGSPAERKHPDKDKDKPKSAATGAASLAVAAGGSPPKLSPRADDDIPVASEVRNINTASGHLPGSVATDEHDHDALETSGDGSVPVASDS